jgi:hypothetical protein
MAQNMHGLTQNNTAHRDSGARENGARTGALRVFAQVAYPHARTGDDRLSDEHRLDPRDASGRFHPVTADARCRNTAFGAEAQQASAHMASWLAAGMRDFRLAFAHETAAQVVEAA